VNILSVTSTAPFPVIPWLLDLEGSGAQPGTVPASTPETPGGRRTCRDPRIRRHRYESRLRRTEGIARDRCGRGSSMASRTERRTSFLIQHLRPLQTAGAPELPKHSSAGSTP
jgi:hypothetical protein